MTNEPLTETVVEEVISYKWDDETGEWEPEYKTVTKTTRPKPYVPNKYSYPSWWSNPDNKTNPPPGTPPWLLPGSNKIDVSSMWGGYDPSDIH